MDTLTRNKFLQSDTRFDLHNPTPGRVTDDLPPLTYSVQFDSQQGRYFLEIMEDLTLPDRIYGDQTTEVERVFNTFTVRPYQTGIHLIGDKGSGKTLMAKQLSVLFREHNYPTLIVNTGFCGEGFNRFISGIQTPCFVLFDEFDKVYHERGMQNALLTLFDGTQKNKKLFCLTTNKSTIGELCNRPGRMFYQKTFSALDPTVTNEFVKTNLKRSKKEKTTLLDFVKMTGENINFDVLQAIVEEMNRYPDPLQSIIKLMNVETYSAPFHAKVFFEPTDKDKYKRLAYETTFYPSGSETIYIERRDSNKAKNIKLSPDNLVSCKPDLLVYQAKEGAITVRRQSGPEKPDFFTKSFTV